MPSRLRNLTRAGLLGLFIFVHAGTAMPSVFNVTVDTSSLTGTPADLAFDFIDGGPPANSVTIYNFAMTGGTLGSSSPSGDVTGAFPGAVTLSDTQLFNEYLQNVTLGTALSFSFNSTGNPADLSSSSIPDGFSFYFLDPNNIDPSNGLEQSLLWTGDPTGSGAVFLYSVGDPDPLAVYPTFTIPPPGEDSQQVPVTATAVPEPGSLALLVVGFIGLAARRRSQR